MISGRVVAMGMYKQRKVMRSARHKGDAVRSGAPTDRLAKLQRHADGSQPVQQLRTLQRDAVKSGAPDWAQEDYVNKVGKKGEVDTSSITHSDRADLNPTPRKNRDGSSMDPADGVKLWAVHEYLMAPVTVMCSMKDGLIGSIYFDGGRVRTTHIAGPTTSEHPADQLFQYNIDRAAAFQEFHEEGARKHYAEKYPDRHPTTHLNWWIARRLRGEDRANVPTWANPIESVEDALDDTPAVDDEGLTLFEVMIYPEGATGTHTSRGVGVKSNLRITRAQLAQLKKVGKLFANETDKRMANQFFYSYVAKSLPQLLPYIRHPSDIDY